jgi:hypothetical protein
VQLEGEVRLCALVDVELGDKIDLHPTYLACTVRHAVHELAEAPAEVLEAQERRRCAPRGWSSSGSQSCSCLIRDRPTEGRECWRRLRSPLSTFARTVSFYGLPAVGTLDLCRERRVLRASRGRNTRPLDYEPFARAQGRRSPKRARGRGLGDQGETGGGAPHTRCAGPFRTFQERVPGRAIQNIPLPLGTQGGERGQ